MNINDLSTDLRKQIFFLCDEPGTTSLVCEKWRKDTEELVSHIGISATQNFMTWGLQALIKRYSESLPKFLTKEDRKTALVFRRTVLRQQDEFQQLFSRFFDLDKCYPNIPSICGFIQMEETISIMNDLSFSFFSTCNIFRRINNPENLERIRDLYDEFEVLQNSVMNIPYSVSFNELHSELLSLNTSNINISKS